MYIVLRLSLQLECMTAAGVQDVGKQNEKQADAQPTTTMNTTERDLTEASICTTSSQPIATAVSIVMT